MIPASGDPVSPPSNPEALCASATGKDAIMGGTRPTDPFGARASLTTPLGAVAVHRLDRLAAALGAPIDRLPFSIRILVESALRHCDGYQVTEDDVRRLAGWTPKPGAAAEIPFKPARVILQ